MHLNAIIIEELVVTSKLRNPSKTTESSKPSKSKISLRCHFVAMSAQSFCSPVEKVGGEGQQTEGDAASNNEVMTG